MNFSAAQWSRRAETALARVPGAAGMLADWRAGVETGRLCLWTIETSAGTRGALVWGVEYLPGKGSALTVFAASCGASEGLSVADAIAAAFDRLAREAGIPVLRFITRRPGLRRRMERHGFKTINDRARQGCLMQREMDNGQQQQQQ